MNFSNPKLSCRIRPDIDALPWVIEGIEKLEQQLAGAQAEVKLLRGALLEICNLPNKYPGHRALRTIDIATTAIIATEPKP